MPWKQQISNCCVDLHHTAHVGGREKATYQINFLGAWVRLERSRQSKERILGSLRHHLGGETCCLWQRHVFGDGLDSVEGSRRGGVGTRVGVGDGCAI